MGSDASRANSVSPSYRVGTPKCHHLWSVHYVSLGQFSGPLNRPFTNVSIGCSLLYV